MGSIWGDVLSAAVPAIVTAGSGLLASGVNRDNEEEDRELELAAQREQNILDLRLAALKAQYGSGGGGGGATKPDPNFISKADRLSAQQNQADTKQEAIANLLTGLQNAYKG